VWSYSNAWIWNPPDTLVLPAGQLAVRLVTLLPNRLSVAYCRRS